MLAARAMPVSDFGHLAAFLGITTLLQVAVDCGVATYVTRERAVRPDSGGVPSALRFTRRSSIALFAILVISLILAGAALDRTYLAMLPLALWAAAERNADTGLSVAFADGDVHVNALNLLSRRALSIALFVALDSAGVEAILAFATASAIAALASAVFSFLYIRKRITATATLGWRELLSRARPYWVNGLATQARNLDVVVVGALAGATSAGLYSSGSRLTSPLRILPTSLATILLPASARAAKSREVLRNLLTLTTCVVAGMTVIYAIIFAGASVLVDSVLGSDYKDSTAVIRIILVGLPFAALASLLNSILQGRGQGRDVAVTSSTTTAACLIGIAITAPWLGAPGAAVVLSASFALQAALLLWRVSALWKSEGVELSGTV